MLNWLFKNLCALLVGAMVALCGLQLGLEMGDEGLWGFFLSFTCGCAGFLLAFALVSWISQRSRFTVVLASLVQMYGSVAMILEWEIDMDSVGGVILSSVFVSVVLVAVFFSILNEPADSNDNQEVSKNQSPSQTPCRPVDRPRKSNNISSSSRPVYASGSFRMIVWSAKMKTWSTVAIRGKIVEGGISSGEKAYFYRDDQLIVADNIAKLEVDGMARSSATKGEIVELILNWTNDAYFSHCTSVTNFKIR
ncbi:MAG: hypothetical protein E7115_07260 [Bacteroidales bacterium]|nr:hypothetical protein [Bacteroidales bacterium]